jgi:hypothetical protein
VGSLNAPVDRLFVRAWLLGLLAPVACGGRATTPPEAVDSGTLEAGLDASMERDAGSDVAESSLDAPGATDDASPEPDAGGATDDASPEPDAGGVTDDASPEPDAGACIGAPCSRSYECCPSHSGAPPVGIACGASGLCEACRTNGLNDPCLGGPPDSSQSPDCCPGLRCVDNRCVL